VARRKTRRSGRGRTERSWRSGQAKRGRRATARNGGANRLIPTAVLQKTHKAVWLLFKAGIRLDQFFSKAKALTARQRARIVDQAMMLLEGSPLERAMYAVDPLQGLRRLRQRLPLMKSDRLFHAEMINIFASVCPFTGLPKEAELRVAFRRSQRIGPQIGNDVEDFGIRPDYVYDMTRNDLLKGNVDLINYAVGLLV
jgi:hypothetical protein